MGQRRNHKQNDVLLQMIMNKQQVCNVWDPAKAVLRENSVALQLKLII